MHQLPATAALALALSACTEGIPFTDDALADGPPTNVQIIDGDTLEIDDTRVRLHGLDAPESDQWCRDSSGREWHCGRAATSQLAWWIVESENLICREAGDGTDRYGRTIAVCEADGRDLNAAMVRSGLAWAYRRYSTDYVGEESGARQAGRGIWSAENVPAWEWRR